MKYLLLFSLKSFFFFNENFKFGICINKNNGYISEKIFTDHIKKFLIEEKNSLDAKKKKK